MLLERRCPGCGCRARFVCEHCWAALDPAPGTALFVYDSRGRSVVLAAKNEGRRDLLRLLGRQLADAVEGQPFDVVTWVPASIGNRRDRGYDQGRLLAKAAAARLGCRHRRLLRRQDHRPQTGRSRRERLAGPQLRARGAVRGRILLVDDVVTTGASLRTGARALRVAGADEVRVMAVAAVP